MNDREIQCPQVAGYTAARREEIFEHQAERNFMFGKLLLTDIAHWVGFLLFFQYIEHPAAAGFLVTVNVTAHGLSLFCRLVRNLFRKTEIESVHRTGLNAERLFILA